MAPYPSVLEVGHVIQGGDQLSTEAKQQLARIFQLVKTWRARTDGLAPRPVAGSSLRKDDQVTDPYHLSHAVIGALVSAVDHLDALRALMEDARIVHARAPYTLLRAALENSSTAVWLLAPSSRDERVLRRLRLQWADSRDGEKAQQLVGAKPRKSAAEWKAKLESIARARGLGEEQVRAVTGRVPTYTEIVKAAGNEARGSELTGRDALFCWMAASGIAHARVWAVLSSVLDRIEVPGVPGVPDNQVGIRLSASDKVVTVLASLTALMMMEGWRLLDERSRRYLG